jgi:hypothetical protein
MQLRVKQMRVFTPIVFIMLVACSKDDVSPLPAVTPYSNPPRDTPLPKELVFDHLYWEVRANTKQLVTRLTVPANYSLEKLRSVLAIGDSITINIPKYDNSSTQSLYYIKSFDQVVVYKNYSDDPPQIVQTGNYYEDLVKALISYAFFIKHNAGFNSIKLRF